MRQFLGFESTGLKFRLGDAQRHTVPGCSSWTLPDTDRHPLSLQFCAELNQPILPNIRKWRGSRGCWKAAVAETPASLLHKVLCSPAAPALSCFMSAHSLCPATAKGILLFPLPASWMQLCVSAQFFLFVCLFCTYLSFVPKCPGFSLGVWIQKEILPRW